MNKWIDFLLKHVPKIFVLVILLALLLLLTWGEAWLYEKVHEFITSPENGGSNLPGGWLTIISLFISAIVIALIFVGIISIIQFIFKIPGLISLVKSWFNPNEPNSPLKSYFEISKTPNHLENPFNLILSEPNGHLPTTIRKIIQHIDQANTLLLSIINHVSNDEEISKKIGDYNKEFQLWGDSWINSAKRALELLERTAINSQILTFKPEHYTELLIKEGLFDEDKESVQPVTEITLVGSMVGFYILLPNALRNYICSLGSRFRTLNIIATQKDYSSSDSYQLVYFALAFVGRTVDAMINGRCNKCFKTLENLNFRINLFFTPFDYMNAAILMHEKSVSILQALDPNSALKIIDDGIQIGLKVRKKDTTFEIGESYFERYKNVIEGYKKDIKKENVESWHISGNVNEIIIDISNRHWDDNYNFNSDPQGNKKIKNKDGITQFLHDFLEHVRQEAGTGTIDDNEQLKKRFDTPCNCEKTK